LYHIPVSDEWKVSGVRLADVAGTAGASKILVLSLLVLAQITALADASASPLAPPILRGRLAIGASKQTC
jgi:hypothetical protein